MHRPFSVTLLAIGVLTLAMVGFIRTWEAFRLWDFLITLQVSPGYLVITGLLAGLVGVVAALGLWRGVRWGARVALTYVGTILIFYWIDRLFVAQSLVTEINTPFAIGVSLLIALFIAWILFRKPARMFFS
ncbi:MAG: hypothetical protein H6636_02220 [Anaerolineales bacterium]|nr:hypothetical protein [Anaerolineales bacterium]